MDTSEYDLLCFSHLRWDFVYQRPQHLLGRCARERRVFFFEEPVFGPGEPRLVVERRGDGPWVATPHLPDGTPGAEVDALQRRLLDEMIAGHDIRAHVDWYYSPMALGCSRHLRPLAGVYDCMDELSGFHGAPPALQERERELFARVDLVFTGGHSLYEAKRGQHASVYAFPSSIDAAHFGRAREVQGDPADQAEIPRPRLGFFGVVDERMDLGLVAALADARPDWQIVMIGPVVKIDPAGLPRRGNIHWLGGRTYAELPVYIAGWDVAIMPFARNAATRFISPTKTPEYLAAGRPVVSTSIRDVVRPYGVRGLVGIADEPAAFVAAVEEALALPERARWLAEVDQFLAGNSWDETWARMRRLIGAAVRARSEPRAAARPASREFTAG
jgi:UDP-galactopyranose mutase